MTVKMKVRLFITEQ